MVHLGLTFTTFFQPPRCGDVRWKTRATTPLTWWYSQINGVFKASPIVTTKIQDIRHGVPLRALFILPSTDSLLFNFFSGRNWNLVFAKFWTMWMCWLCLSFDPDGGLPTCFLVILTYEESSLAVMEIFMVNSTIVNFSNSGDKEIQLATPHHPLTHSTYQLFSLEFYSEDWRSSCKLTIHQKMGGTPLYCTIFWAGALADAWQKWQGHWSLCGKTNEIKQFTLRVLIKHPNVQIKIQKHSNFQHQWLRCSIFLHHFYK